MIISLCCDDGGRINGGPRTVVVGQKGTKYKRHKLISRLDDSVIIIDPTADNKTTTNIFYIPFVQVVPTACSVVGSVRSGSRVSPPPFKAHLQKRWPTGGAHVQTCTFAVRLCRVHTAVAGRISLSEVPENLCSAVRTRTRVC